MYALLSHKQASPKLLLICTVLSFLLIGCTNKAPIETTHPSPIVEIPTQTAFPAFASATQKTHTAPEKKTPTPRDATGETQFLEFCLKPSDDYQHIFINGHGLNLRTFEMLAYAKTLYNGAIDITGDAITQGSYTSGEPASYGTHSGGGAVDLSVMAPGTYAILEPDIEPLTHALRLAGFAAWYRDFDVLYPGSPVHIHAIAIGDRDLSLAAREQLAGPHGYFWGFNGLPAENGDLIRDPHGGPILCPWMIEMGYPAKTSTPSPGE